MTAPTRSLIRIVELVKRRHRQLLISGVTVGKCFLGFSRRMTRIRYFNRLDASNSKVFC